MISTFIQFFLYRNKGAKNGYICLYFIIKNRKIKEMLNAKPEKKNS